MQIQWDKKKLILGITFSDEDEMERFLLDLQTKIKLREVFSVGVDNDIKDEI